LQKSGFAAADNLDMDQFKVRISLKYKLLVLLVSLPLISLGLYLFMATDLFQKDKVAYVFDSSATVSRSLAGQLRLQLNSTFTSALRYVEMVDSATGGFSPAAQDVFAKNKSFHALLLFRRDPSTGQYNRIGQMLQKTPQAEKFVADVADLNLLRDQAVQKGAFLHDNSKFPGTFNVSFRLGERTEPNHTIVMAMTQSEEILSAFQSTGLYSSFVLTRSGQIAIGGLEVVATDLQALQNVLQSKVAEGTAEARLSDGRTYLISYANVGVGDMMVVSKIDKQKALKAVEVLFAKSILFFIALLASTLLISVFASNQLTSTLRELFEATRKIAQGDFNVKIASKSNDEVGGLAVSFNWMAAEVSRLMSETAEKARMESELSTVRTVQETLFPAPQSQFGPIRIAGHFEPASECGGDWWNYSRVDNKIYIWIGDATGHGAPAALITSAARSAAAVIESMPDMNPAKAMTVLNRAIHQTSKGQILMTFFIACIDLDSRKFTYASASHDPPYLMRANGAKLSRKDLRPLNDVNGPRLGDQRDFQYDLAEVDYGPGDLLFFYTDGILDIENPERKKWGERAFLKTLVDSANAGLTPESKLDLLRDQVNSYRRGQQLIDDVTMVMCEFERERPAA